LGLKSDGIALNIGALLGGRKGTAHSEASARNAQTTYLLVKLSDGVLSTVLETGHFSSYVIYLMGFLEYGVFDD